MKEIIRRRKIEAVIRDLRRAAEHPEMEDRGDALWHAAWNAARLADQLVARPDLLGELLGGLRAVRDSGGPGAQIAERDMHRALWAVADGADEALCEAGAPRSRPEEAAQAPAELRPMYDVLALLAGYAMDCLHFRRQRDSYGGERREKAMELLGMVYRQIELPGMAELVTDLWERADKSSERAVAWFFESCGEDQAALLNAELDRRLARRNPGPCQLD
jgi:hypothetical protein